MAKVKSTKLTSSGVERTNFCHHLITKLLLRYTTTIVVCIKHLSENVSKSKHHETGKEQMQ